jgi:RimJ/RimL family protein N-acetyltransferase
MSQETRGAVRGVGDGVRGASAGGFVLETARLGLRPHALADVPFMRALNADPEVVRYTGEPTSLSEAEAAAIVEALGRQYAESGTGRFLVIERASGEPVGWCGLKRQAGGEVDLGYRFVRSRWGRGIATEAARACLVYGFGPLGFDRIVATAACANAASIAVLSRLGFRPTGEREEHGLEVRGFALRAADFAAGLSGQLSLHRDVLAGEAGVGVEAQEADAARGDGLAPVVGDGGLPDGGALAAGGGAGDDAQGALARGVQERGAVLEADDGVSGGEHREGGADGGRRLDQAAVDAAVHDAVGLEVLRPHRRLEDHLALDHADKADAHGAVPPVEVAVEHGREVLGLVAGGSGGGLRGFIGHGPGG